MKQLCLLIVVAVLAFSGTTQAQSINKTWQLSFKESMAYMPQAQQASFKQLDANMMKMMEKNFERLRYKFAVGGRLEMVIIADGNPVKQLVGTWKRNGNKLSLYALGAGNGDREEFTIVKLTNNLLVIKKDSDQHMAFVAK